MHCSLFISWIIPHSLIQTWSHTETLIKKDLDKIYSKGIDDNMHPKVQDFCGPHQGLIMVDHPINSHQALNLMKQLCWVGFVLKEGPTFIFVQINKSTWVGNASQTVNSHGWLVVLFNFCFAINLTSWYSCFHAMNWHHSLRLVLSILYHLMKFYLSPTHFFY